MSNQSTGQIVLSFAGAVIGAYVGGPQGAQLGFTLGSVAGGLLFPAGVPDGPRINDFNLSTSTYGVAIPKNYGTSRLPGNLIWAGPVVHTGETIDVGKKQSQTVDAVTQSFAMSFCKGPGTLLRLWFDNKIVYDIGLGPYTAGPDIEVNFGGFNLPLLIPTFISTFATNATGNTFIPKFYDGTEDQERDPTIVAVEGEENTPAYRGLCYVVFENLHLAPWGNRIPQVTAEIGSAASDAHPKQEWVLDADCALDQVQLDGVGWDPARGVVYENDPSGIRVFSYPGMVERCVNQSCALPAFYLRGVSPKGYLYVDLYGEADTPLWLLDPDTFQVVGRETISLGGSPAEYLEARYLGFMQDSFGQVFTIVCGGSNGNVAVLQERYIITPDDAVNAICYTGSLDSGFNAVGACGAAKPSWAEFFVLGQSSDTVRFYRGKVFSVPTTGVQSTVTLEAVTSFDILMEFSNVVAFPGDINVRMVGYESTGATVIFMVENPDFGYYLCGYSTTTGNLRFKVWNLVAGGVSYDPSYNISDLSGRTFAVGKGDAQGSPQTGKFYLHSLNDGSIIQEYAWSSFEETTQVTLNQQFWDSRLQAIYISDDLQGNEAGLCFLGRLAGDSVTLAEIVADICDECGLEPSQYDVTDLEADLVHGYPIAATADGRGMLEPLMAAYSFDAVESDYKIKFVKRGGAAVRTIPQDDLAAMDAQNNSVVQQRTQEVELPEMVVVSFIDYTRDYLKGTQSSRRISGAQNSHSTLNVELPIAMSPSRARRIADILLYQAWASRDAFNTKTGWKHLALDPADVINLEIEDDNTIRMRLNAGNIGADYSCELSGQTEDATIYDPVAHQTTGGETPQPIYAGGPASQVQAITIDTTLLNDSDDSGGGVTKYYQALKPLQPDAFSVGGILRSTDNATFLTRATFTAAPTQGKLFSSLSGDVAPFTIHDEDHFDVQVYYGSAPISVSQTDFFAGINTAAIQRSDGETEWVEFRDVTDLGGGLIRCSYLLRGRRGTEVFMSGHQIGDRVVFLRAGQANPGIGMDSLDLGSIGRTLFFAGGAPGQTLLDVNKEVNTISGNDLKPYAPVHLQATLTEGSPQEYILTWMRRTRLGGAWRDDTADVPLAETSEEYEVEILDGNGDVVRTLPDIPGPTVTYTHAQIIEDFGTIPDTLDFRVYQMSSAVGRGLNAVANDLALADEDEPDRKCLTIASPQHFLVFAGCPPEPRRPLILCNCGFSTVTISALNFSDPSFSAPDAELPITLSPGRRLTIEIAFDPAVSGDVAQGELDIVSDSDDSPLVVSLFGISGGVAGAKYWPPDGHVFAFQPTNIFCDGTTLPFLIVNLDTVPITITSIEGVSDVFGIDLTGLELPKTIDPCGGWAAFTISFDPSVPQFHSHLAVNIYSDVDAVRSYSLQGTGISPATDVSASPGSIDFGTMTAGFECNMSATIPVVFTNVGEGEVNVVSFTTSGSSGCFGANNPVGDFMPKRCGGTGTFHGSIECNSSVGHIGANTGTAVLAYTTGYPPQSKSVEIPLSVFIENCD